MIIVYAIDVGNILCILLLHDIVSDKITKFIVESSPIIYILRVYVFVWQYMLLN